MRPRLWWLLTQDEARLRAVEAFLSRIRWIVVVLAFVAVALDAGRAPVAGWGFAVLLLLVNLGALAGLRTARRGAALRALGAVVAGGDGAAAVIAMFNYAHHADSATTMLPLLVVMEAAIRWELPGALIAAAAGGVTNVAWVLYRASAFGFEARGATIVARAGTYLVGGLLLGHAMRQLTEAGREAQRRAQRTEAVARFANDAPRLGFDETAQRLAGLLRDDFGYERTAVVVVADDDRSTFRLVATTGYEHVDLAPYHRFPVTRGVVGRCLRTGEPQLLADVEGDPDYMAVDPLTRSEMAVPLRGREGVFGVIDVAATETGAFDDEDLALLEAVGAQVARAFENARLAEVERKTVQELEELAAMKDDFIAIANHELRTPVTTIAGFAQSLLRQRASMSEEEVADAIERIARQSIRLRSLIEDLLTVPRTEGARRGLQLGDVCLEEVADEVVREFRVRDERCRIVTELGSDLPAVRADADALRRVIVNLLDNATKYSPEGATVTLRARSEDGAIRVEVEDEGPGVPPEYVDKLFTKFGRAVGAAGRPGGMGLGLFIVKELVEEMGGSVGVDTIPGRGSCFWFRLRTSTEGER